MPLLRDRSSTHVAVLCARYALVACDVVLIVFRLIAGALSPMETGRGYLRYHFGPGPKRTMVMGGQIEPTILRVAFYSSSIGDLRAI